MIFVEMVNDDDENDHGAIDMADSTAGNPQDSASTHPHLQHLSFIMMLTKMVMVMMTLVMIMMKLVIDRISHANQYIDN